MPKAGDADLHIWRKAGLSHFAGWREPGSRRWWRRRQGQKRRGGTGRTSCGRCDHPASGPRAPAAHQEDEDASEESNRDPADRQQRPGRGRAPMATSSTTLCRESAMRNDAQDGGRSSVSSAGHPGELQLTLCCGPPRAYSARRSRMTALTVRPSRAARARATS